MNDRLPLDEVAAHFRKQLEQAPRILGNDAVNFFLDSFRKQGFTDKSFQPWQKRKSKKDTGRAILVKTARLKRSIRITDISISDLTTKVGTDVPYARPNNEGFKGTVNVKAFTRQNYSRHKATSESGRMKTVQRLGGVSHVKAHTRKVNLPKRQFMGESEVMTKQLTNRLTGLLSEGLKNISVTTS